MKPSVYVAYGIESGLRIEGIVASFQEEKIGAAFEECFCLLAIRIGHFIERNGSFGGLTHVGRECQRFRRGTHGTGHVYLPARPSPNLSLVGRGVNSFATDKAVRRSNFSPPFKGGVGGGSVGHLSGQPCTFASHFCRDVRATIFMLADAVGGESVCGNDVGSGLDVESVNLLDDIGFRQAKDIVVAHQRDWPRGESSPVETLWGKPESLNPGAHRAIENEDVLGQLFPYFLKRLLHFRVQRYDKKLKS